MKIFFLLNPSEPSHTWDYRNRVAAEAKKAGWTPRFGTVDRRNPDSTYELLRQAIEEKCMRVVAVGGDGSLNRVLDQLRKLKALGRIEVGVIPLGTCNDFARYLGLSPRHQTESIRHACNGDAQPVDLGLMGNQLFINNAGFGRRPSSGKNVKRLIAWRTLQAFREFEPIPLTARWEKGAVQGEFYMALVCNAPYFSNGMHFSRAPRPDDGLFDVYLVPVIPKWSLWPRFVLGRLGRALGTHRMLVLKTGELEIEARTDLWPQVDGEPPPLRPVRKVVFKLVPEKAMLVFPKKDVAESNP